MLSKRQTAIFALLIASLIWGATSPIFKWSLETLPTFYLAFSRFFLAALLLFPFAAKKLSIDLQDLPAIVWTSLLGITFNIFFFFTGLKLTLAINSAIITASIPVLTLIASSIILKEKMGKKLIIGAAISFLGLLVILSPDLLRGGLDSNLLGNFFLVIATLAWVFYEISSKQLFKKYSVLTLTFYSFLFGAVSFFPFAVWQYFQDPQGLNIIFTDQKAIIGTLYGAVFSSAIAYFLWQWGLSKIPVSEAGFFLYLNPLSAILVAIPLLGEKITLPYLFGSIFIIIGVILAEQKRRAHPLAKKLSLTP